MTVIKLCLLYLAIVLSCCEAYKILVVFPVPGKSHGILGEGYVRHLLQDGHEVTYITPFLFKSTSDKLRFIDVSDNIKTLPEDVVNIQAIMNKEVDMMDYGVLLPMFFGIAKISLENENVQKLINDPKEQFDVVIAEWMFSKLLSGLAPIFNCPLIWSSSVETHWGILRMIDQPANPAYVGDPMSSYIPPFTFSQRVSELYTQLKVYYMEYKTIDELEEQVYETSIAPAIAKRGRQPPLLKEIAYNASLVLGNSHPSLGQATPLPQSYISIGGYHIEEDVKPLTEDLKNILDTSKNGVIYFSMGSTLKSKQIPKELKDNILKMFGELKQTVLWKFEDDLPNLPKNVHILKWAPQQSILSHPNVILFITHGGLLSTTETVHFGVPIIGIPVFADQFLNVARAVQRGFALKVDLSLTMAGELKAAIEEVITNPKYAGKVKELSLIYHDRTITPGKELVHWVKHVIRTNGAPHLRSPALDVPFYQKLYLDLGAVILVIVLILTSLLKYVCKIICSKNNVTSGKKNK